MQPWVARIAARTRGGISEVVPVHLSERIPKNATAQHKRRKMLPRMATTAAAVTEADRFGEPSIKRLYITC